jgi:hypothetical protein
MFMILCQFWKLFSAECDMKTIMSFEIESTEWEVAFFFYFFRLTTSNLLQYNQAPCSKRLKIELDT